MEKVDAHVIAPAEYNDVPELDDAFFENAALHEDGKPQRRSESSKQEVTLSIDSDVLERFRATGTDWPNRVNEVLRQAAKHLL